MSAYLLRCCHGAGGVSRSASWHRGCVSEDMLLETGFGDEEAPRLHGRKWGGVCVCVRSCVCERESVRACNLYVCMHAREGGSEGGRQGEKGRERAL